MKTINQKDYYRKIKQLNILHYTGEIAYYTKAPFRTVEKKLLEKINLGAYILDLGCGPGRFSIAAAQLGFNVIGVDIAPKVIEAARQRARQLSLNNLHFIIGDMTHLSFKDKSFDCVFCPRFSINAVATFSQKKKAIKEMLRVVKPGGTVFIESFNKFYLGKGSIFFIRNILWDIRRYFLIFYAWLRNKEYKGLLPGDIVYKSNKVIDAPKGYAHIPTIFELKRLIPQNTKFRFYSIPQIMQNKKFDLFKFFRYSIWIIINK